MVIVYVAVAVLLLVVIFKIVVAVIEPSLLILHRVREFWSCTNRWGKKVCSLYR
jgi:hypothetical protein